MASGSPISPVSVASSARLVVPQAVTPHPSAPIGHGRLHLVATPMPRGPSASAPASAPASMAQLRRDAPLHSDTEPEAREWPDATAPVSPTSSTGYGLGLSPGELRRSRAAALEDVRRALGEQHSRLAEVVRQLPNGGRGSDVDLGPCSTLAPSVGACSPSGARDDAAEQALLVVLRRDMEGQREQQRLSEERLLEELERHGQRTGALEESVASLRREVGRLQASVAGFAQRGGGREDLRSIREEQEEALAKQTELLRNEFEAAYRAERAAETALARLAGLEHGIVDVRADFAQEFERLRAKLETEAASAAESGLREGLAEVRKECASELEGLRAELGAEVPSLAEAAGCAAARELLAEMQSLAATSNAQIEALRSRVSALAQQSDAQSEALQLLSRTTAAEPGEVAGLQELGTGPALGRYS